jgi:hypothetical protein
MRSSGYPELNVTLKPSSYCALMTGIGTPLVVRVAGRTSDFGMDSTINVALHDGLQPAKEFAGIAREIYTSRNPVARVLMDDPSSIKEGAVHATDAAAILSRVPSAAESVSSFVLTAPVRTEPILKPRNAGPLAVSNAGNKLEGFVPLSYTRSLKAAMLGKYSMGGPSPGSGKITRDMLLKYPTSANGMESPRVRSHVPAAGRPVYLRIMGAAITRDEIATESQPIVDP